MISTVTPLGRKCREIRSRYGVKLHDQARNTKSSSSYISLIERGQRPVPDGFIEAFSNWLGLSSSEVAGLQEAALASGGRQTTKAKTARLQLANEVAASVYSMPLAQLERLRTLIAQPSKQSYTDDEICERAALFRAVFIPNGKVEIDIVEIVETYLALVDPEYSLVVEPDAKFRAEVEAYSDQSTGKSGTVVASERLYSTANWGNASSRYALLHEFAHWVLHRDEAHAFFRLAKTGRALGRHQAREYEADRFAREFAFPKEIVSAFARSDDLAHASSMPANVAATRFAEVRRVQPTSERGSTDFSLLPLDSAHAPQVGSIAAQPETTASARVLLHPSFANQPLKAKPRKSRGRATTNDDDLFAFADKRDANEAERQAREVPTSASRSNNFFREHGWR